MQRQLRDVLQLLEKDGTVPLDDISLCGGAWRSVVCGERVKDYDLFAATPAAQKAMYAWMLAYTKNLPKHITPTALETFNALTAKICDRKLQLVLREHGSTMEVLKLFDFTSSMFGCPLSTLGHGVWRHETALYDCAARRLVINPGHRNPFSVIYRIVKLERRGWRVWGRDVVRLILECLIKAKHIHTLGDVRNEVLYMDTLILMEFFKSFSKWPPEQPLEELELKELQDEIDCYFERRPDDTQDAPE